MLFVYGCSHLTCSLCGALYLKPFARIAGSGTTAVDLLIATFSVIYTAAVVMPVNDQILKEQMQNAPINMAGFAQNATWATPRNRVTPSPASSN